jgi:hypothetical protein
MAVAAQASFAANDLCAKFTEHARNRRPRSAGREFDNANAFKGKLAHSIQSLWSIGVME